MAGISDKIYRLLVKKQGAALVCSEMISATALKYNPNPRFILASDPSEHPISMQLFGGIAEDFGPAAQRLEALGADMIDLNAACPVPKVIKQGAGSALLRDPIALARIISTLRKATQLPLSIKVRLGWDQHSINILQTAKIAESEGADALIIHGRTRSQGYTGKADWSYIKQVKEQVGIPVIGSGDIDTPDVAKTRLTESGCDGIMIGRAAIGNPWIFREIAAFLNNEPWLKPSLNEKIALAYEHSVGLAAFKSEKTALKEMRKFLIKYFKGIPEAAQFRVRLSLVSTIAELEVVLTEIKKSAA